MGELDKYLESIQNYSDFKVEIPLVDYDLLQRAENRLDRDSYAAYGLALIRQTWKSLPDEIKDIVFDKIEDLYKKGAGEIINSASGLISGLLASFGWIGIIIEAVIGIIKLGFKAEKEIAKNEDAISLLDKTMSWAVNFSKLGSTPSKKWIAGIVENENYFDFDRGGSFPRRHPYILTYWWRKPSLRPCRDESKIWGLRACKTPTGECSKGRPYRDFQGKPRCCDYKNCSSEIAISALYYPYWRPNGPAEPLPWYRGKDIFPPGVGFKPDTINANEDLIKRQMSMIIDPKINFQLSGSDVLRPFRKFKQFWNQYDLRIHSKKIAAAQWEESKKAVRYYYKNGLIHTYFSNKDLNDVAIEINDTKITYAQYNTIVSATRAFFSNRSLFLKDPNIKKTALKKKWKVDPAIKKAIKEKPKVYVIVPELLRPVPTPSVEIPKRAVKKPERIKKEPAKIKRKPSSTPIIIAAAAGIGLLALSRKR